MSYPKQTRAELVEALATLQQEVAIQKQTAHNQTQLLTAEREHRQLTELLLRSATALHSRLDYDAVLDCLLEQMGLFITADAASIWLVEAGATRCVRWRYEQSGGPVSPPSMMFDLADLPPLQDKLPHNEPWLVSRTEAENGWTRRVGRWINAYLITPICAQGNLIGFLNVNSALPDAFSATDADRFSRLADQAGPALNNARLYTRSQQKIDLHTRTLVQEQNFISTILDTTEALVMVLDLHGRILRFNRACEVTTGFRFEEVTGRPFWDLFLTNDEATGVKANFRRLQEEGRLPDEDEHYWITKDGHRRLIAWTNTVIAGEAGQAEYVVATGIDVTEPRQLEDRLVAIHQLGRELNLFRDEAAIWEIALETAAFLLEYKSAGYGVVNELTSELEYYYQPVRGVPAAMTLSLPLEREERIQALKHYGEQATHSPEAARLVSLVAAGSTGYTWLTAPMRVGDRLIGVLDVEVHRAIHSKSNDQQLLQTLADQTAVAIENARLHHEARQRVDELTTMNMISQAITSTLNLEDTLTIITDHAIRLLEATAASVVLSDEAKGYLWFHAASGGSSDFVRGKRLPPGEGIVGWVIEHGDPVLVPDVSQDPRFFGDFDKMTGFKTQSVICAPLQTGPQTIGAIEVLNKKVGAFIQEDLQLVSWLATPAATAIENARLFEAEHAARKQAEILREATATLTSSLDINRVLNSILVHLERVVSYDNAYVFLRNEDWLQAVAGRGVVQDEQNLINRRYPADSVLYQEIRETGRPVILADAQSDPRYQLWGNYDGDIRGWMGVPLMVQSQVIGCLTLNSHRAGAFGRVEADLTQAFANQATVAIQNARLFEQVRVSSERLQSLSRRLVEVQELERRHIARELHDEAGQSLSSLMVGLRLLEREVENPEATLEGIVKLKSLTNEISENLHRLAIDLRPASLDHLGLVAALRQHIEAFGRQNELITQFEAVGLNPDKRLPPAVETNIYRIVQEALTNVVRHAKASQIDVLLERRGDQVVAIIEDNGVGFDAEAAGQSGRLGLLGMRERAEMLNGNLMIESAVGAGTTVYVEVPYDHTDSDS